MIPTPTALTDAAALEALLAADGLLDALPWGVLVLDEQRVIRRVNRQAARWGGTVPEALLGQPLAGAGLPAALSDPLLRLLEAPDAATAHEAYLPEPPRWLAISAARQPGGWVLFGQDITDLKQSQADALRLQAELTQRTTDQYLALFNVMDEGFCVLEMEFDAAGEQVLDYRFREVNPAFERQSGLRDVRGKSIRELVPDLEPFWFELYGRVALSGEPTRYERQVTPLGRWFGMHAFRLGPPEARQVGVLFNDITARKQAEAQQAFLLALSDALRPLADPGEVQSTALRLLGEHLRLDRCGYLEVHADDEHATVEREYRVAGIASFVGTYRLDDYGPDLVAAVRRADTLVVDDMAETPDNADLVTATSYAENSIRAFIAKPLVKHGRLVAVLFAHYRTPRHWTPFEVALVEETAERTWDAVERARAEADRAASEAKYRSLFNSIDEGFVVSELLYDEQGRPTDALMLETNPSYDRIMRTTGAAGRRAREVFPDSESAWFEAYAQVVETGEGLRFENYFAPLDSWMEMYISRVGDAGSRRFASVFHDITARKQAEGRQAYLLALSDALRPVDDAAAVQATVTDMARRYFAADRCYYAEVAGDLVTIRQDAARPGLPSVAAVYSLREMPLFRAVMQENRPVVVADVDTSPLMDENLKQLCRDNYVLAYLNVLVRRGGQLVGMLCLSQATPRAWTALEADLLQETAERTWTAVEQARAETALVASEAKYRSLFDSIDDGFCTVEVLFDAQGQAIDYRFLEANPAFERQTGLVNAVGRTMRELVPAHEDFWFETYGRVAQTGEAQRFEHEAAALGSFYDVYAFRVGDPAAHRVAVLFSDILARKQAETALRRSEEQFRLFVTASSDVLYRMSADWQQMLHLDGRNVLADTAAPLTSWLEAYIPPAERPVVEPTIRAAIEGRQFFALEHRVFQADGSVGWTSSRAVPLLDERGELTEWFGTATDITARRQAEEALRASEQRQHFLLANLPGAAVFVVDRELRYQLAEGDALRQAGHTSADFLGHTVREMVEPAHWPAFQDLLEQALAGHPFAHEHEQAGRIFLTHGVPWAGPAGQVDAVLAVSYDLTERKQAEEALRVSEAKYRMLFETMDQGFIVGEVLPAGPGRPIDFRWLEANSQVERLTMMPRAALLSGKTVRDVIPQFEDFLYEQYEQVALTGEPMRFEQHAQVLGRWFDVYVYALDGPASRRVGLLFTNITERKQTEEALRVSEAKYRHLFETMDQGFGVGEVTPAGPGRPADFRWLDVNPQVEHLTSMPQAALLGGDTMRAVMPELEDAWYERYEQVALSGEPVRFEEYARVLDRWFDVYAYPLEGPVPHRVALLFTNITARKQAEEALRLAEENHRAELEQRVAARTQELRESRHLLQTVFDASPTAIVVMRILRDAADQAEDFEIVIYNEFNKQVVGRDDLAGQRFTAMFPQTVPTGTLARLLQVATTGEPIDFEQWYVGEGMQHWFRHIAVRQGGLLVLTSEVITARKQAEQERISTLSLLEQAETVAGLGSWDYDVATGQFVWSDGMYRLFGLPLGQPVEPEIYLDYVVAEDRLRAEQFVRQLRAGPQNVKRDVEETLRLRVGRVVKTVRLKFIVLRDEQGRPVRTLGVDLDISELHRLEQDNLRLRLTQQRALFEAVQAAQETERRRMAESLHNGIGQMLYATKLRLDRLHTPVLHTSPALVAARDEADQLLGEAIRQTRALSHELVPVVLEDFGLTAALQDIGNKMSTPRLRLRSQVVLDAAAAPLAPSLQMALYRMAQELAQNIVKHARDATQASLELETTPGWVLLRAEDNGPGFDPHPPQGAGLGLRSIRDRVALLGGQLETGTVPAGGAYVRIRIPLEAG